MIRPIIFPCPFCGHAKPRLKSVLRKRRNPNGQVVLNEQPLGPDWEWHVPDFRHQFYVRCFKCGAKGPNAFTPWHTPTEEECEDIYPEELDWGYKPESDFAAEARFEAVALWNNGSAEEESCPTT